MSVERATAIHIHGYDIVIPGTRREVDPSKGCHIRKPDSTLHIYPQGTDTLRVSREDRRPDAEPITPFTLPLLPTGTHVPRIFPCVYTVFKKVA
jgi:hypothetical protein